MSRPRPRPLFSAAPQVFKPAPGESDHPQSFTGRLRRFLTTDGEALFRAEQLQAEYHRKLEETETQPRN